MSEFVGRTGSLRVYSYPVSRWTGLIGPFARNFAVGPAKQQDVASVDTGGTQIQWVAIESGAPPGVNVPITPKSTGLIRVSAVVVLGNTTASPITALVQVQLDGVTLPLPFQEIDVVDANRPAAIPILMEIPPPTAPLALGVTRNIEILVSSGSGASTGDLVLIIGSSSIDVQEMPPATG